MNRLKTIFAICGLMLVMGLSSCIEDGISNDVNDQPTFSTDTLNMGPIFTEAGTPTHSFTVYNRHDKVMNISSIKMRDDAEGMFRLNVDGVSGKEFQNMEIRPNDSIYVFVEATLKANNSDAPIVVERHLDFVVQGVTSTVVITAEGQDVERKHGVIIENDTRFTANKPYQIFDSLVVKEGATLTLDPGVTLYFHNNATMRVDGTLVSNGTVEKPVNMTGDRIDNVVNDLSFDLMAGQWAGLEFSPTSRNNYLSHTSIRNTVWGVFVDSIGVQENPALTLINCQLRNSQEYSLASLHSDIKAVGCEITDAAAGVMFLRGGNHIFNHCTFANYYLFSALGGAAIQLDHISAECDDLSGLPYMTADFTNSIIYGNGSDISHGDLTGTAITLRYCLLKSEGVDDDNFICCLWGQDPLYYTVRNEYIFDYRLKNESPAIGAAYPEYTLPEAQYDRYGLPRGAQPDLGAFVYVPAEEEDSEN